MSLLKVQAVFYRQQTGADNRLCVYCFSWRTPPRPTHKICTCLSWSSLRSSVVTTQTAETLLQNLVDALLQHNSFLHFDSSIPSFHRVVSYTRISLIPPPRWWFLTLRFHWFLPCSDVLHQNLISSFLPGVCLFYISHPFHPWTHCVC